MYGEVFLNNTQSNFETNRTSATLGYQIDKSWLLSAGWINQKNYMPVKSHDKDNIIVMPIYRIQFKHATTREHILTIFN
jgi:hypothetical protein